MRRRYKGPADLQYIAERFAPRSEVRLLRPFRMFLHIKKWDVCEMLRITRAKLGAYEKLRRLMPRGEFYACESCYVNELLKQGILTRKEHQRVQSSNRRLIFAEPIIRLKMTPMELFKWKQRLVDISNIELQAMVKCGHSALGLTISRLEYAPWRLAQLEAILNDLWQKEKQKDDYESYYEY